MQPEVADPWWMNALLFTADLLKIFLAAFLGAACAFAYERRKKKEEDSVRRTTALRMAQFALSTRVNSLLIIHKQFLHQQKDNPNRWVELPPVLYVTNSPPLPMEDLGFLLDNIAPNLLGELYVAGNKFDTVSAIISTRNGMHDEFQRTIEQGHISERLKVQLTHFTDALFDQLPDAAIYINSTHKKLEAVMHKHFPGVNALRFGNEVDEAIKNLQPTAPVYGGDTGGTEKGLDHNDPAKTEP